MSLTNYKLTIEYDGTEYHGWQRQPRERTVQGMLETAVAAVFEEHDALVGASRTDRGVHALGQVASVRGAVRVPTDRLAEVLNHKIPPDIRVREVSEVDADFNARHSAVGKHYRYALDRREVPRVFTSRYALHAPGGLDLERLAAAGQAFVGVHDFAAMQCAQKGPPKPTQREIYAVECHSPNKDEVTIDVWGRSFLYKMVRTMVGTLLEVGQGRQAPECVQRILGGGERAAAGPTAPAHGLTLWRVFYSDAELASALSARKVPKCC